MRKKWFYDAQRLFREWKRKNDLSGECSKQIITPYTLEEMWYLRSDSSYEVYTLYAFKNTPEVYIVPYNSHERIYLKNYETASK